MTPGDQRQMPSASERPPAGDADLRHYLTLLIRRWWIIAAVYALTVLLALAFGDWSSSEVYEARTRLLIIDPISDRVIGDGGSAEPNPLTRLSMDTLLALVRANDLLESVIVKLDLRDSEKEPWSATGLAAMLESEIDRSSGETYVPLLTTTVRAGDPELAKRIANAWATAFMQKNIELFVSEAAGSYDFVLGQYQKNLKDLRGTQAERLTYEQATGNRSG